LFHAVGDGPAALRDAELGLESAREAVDAQAVVPLAARNAHLRVDGRLFDEVLDLIRDVGAELGPPLVIPDAVAAATVLGREAELAATLKASVGGTVWREVAVASLEGDYAKAVDIYGQLEAFPAQADTRARLAQTLADQGKPVEAEAELQRALTFWRSVGATAYVREAEELLAARAS
jgi:tetratricopeptide (TPR) repeat protein